MVEYISVNDLKRAVGLKTLYVAEMFSPEIVWVTPFIEATHNIANDLKTYFGELEVKRGKNPIFKEKVEGKMLRFGARKDIHWNYINAKTPKKFLGIVSSTEEETIFALEERVFEDEDEKTGIGIHINLLNNDEAEKIVKRYLDKLAEDQNIDRIYLRKGFK